MRSFLSFSLALTLVAFLSACGGSGNVATSSGGDTGGGGVTQGAATLQSIAVNPSTAAIAQGTTQAFTAMGTYSDGSTKDLTTAVQWACLNPTVVTVSNTAPTQGLASSVAAGTALVSATMGVVSSNATLTIKNVGLQTTIVDGVSGNTPLTMTPSTANIGFGDQQQFKAVATFSDGSTQDVTNQVTWFAVPSPPALPDSIISSGLAIGTSAGSNVINAIFSTGSGVATGTATLNVDFSNLVGLSVTPSTLSVPSNAPSSFYAIGTFSDGSTRDLSSMAMFSSSNFLVASFGYQGGSFGAASPGTAAVTASVCTVVDPITFLCDTMITSPPVTLTVTPATLTSVSVLPPDATIAPTTKLGMSAIGVFSDSSALPLTSSIIWQRSNYSASLINATTGVVTGVAPGGATTITAQTTSTFDKIAGSTPLTVSDAVLSSIAITPSTAFTVPGASVTYKAVGTFSDGSTQDLTKTVSWSTKASVASVQNNVATGTGIGSAVITAKLGTISGSTTLAVASPEQFSLAVTPATLQIAQQTSAQLTATGTFADGTTHDLTTAVTWSSSDASAATVGYQTGILAGLSAGTSTITATLGTVTSTAQVTVSNATLTSIAVSPASPSVALAGTLQLTATGTFSDGSTQPMLNVTWSSSSPAVAYVNASGLATGTATGTATMSATVNGVSGSTVLTVQ